MPLRLAHGARFFLFLLLSGFFVFTASSTYVVQTSSPTNCASAAPSKDASQASTNAYHLPPEKYQKAIAYSHAGYRLYFVSVFWSIALLLLLLRLHFFVAVRDFAEARTTNRFLQAAILVPILFLTLAVLNLPIRVYWHHLSLGYEQSIQPWGSWFEDWAKAELLSVALAVPIIFVLFTLIRRKPHAWWYYAWLGAIPLTVFLIFVSPWYIDPLFNKFQPLQEKYPQLTESIVRLTYAAGYPVPRDRIFLMEASVKTNAVNAYVTGLGNSTRIVVWDTAIRKSTPDELLAIVGHEMGHYVMHHVAKGVAFFLVLLAIALYLAYHFLQWLLARWGKDWGIRVQSDWAAIGVLLLLFNVMNFFGEPIGNAFSRMEEHAADVYGLEVTYGLIPNANEVTAHSFQVLGEEDLDDPDPPKFIVFWLYSHPPLDQRLRFALDFKPSK